ncbi:MAG TPA: citrate synthase [Dehalococcoidia bacterium]|nr:citrate synthase [Dehalococcoidia bacterium]
MTSETRTDTKIYLGLEDIPVVASSICSIDGVNGRLLYRGYDIADLASSATFEEVVHLLWFGELPNARQLESLRGDLRREQQLPDAIIDLIRTLPRDGNSMSALRTLVSALALYAPESDVHVHDEQVREAIRLTVRMGTIVAAWGRHRAGEDPLQPDPDLGLAANFLAMLFGRRPDPAEEHAFDVALILHADHELNASTFAARVTAATLSDMYSAVTSAIGALKGPLHGGANEQVMRMLETIRSPEEADEYVRDRLARHERLMGFGHRVYRVEDPRATQLRRLSKELGELKGDTRWYDTSIAIEQAVRRERGLNPNVDFYSASLYHTLGIPTELFTPIFAVSRISGWTAHILEQYEHNRLIRPRAEYTGSEGRQYVSVEQRSA